MGGLRVAELVLGVPRGGCFLILVLILIPVLVFFNFP